MPAVNLRCDQCGYENEAERVYCHNCGGKLDRTLLPKAEDDKKRETPEKARRRIKRMTNPGSNPVVREFKALLSTLFWAAIVAGLVVALRAPHGVPDPKGAGLNRLVQSELMEAIESPAPKSISFSQEEVNASLKQSLKGKEGGLIPGIKFGRAFVNFYNGAVRVTTQQDLWGFPFYSSTTYKIGMKDGKFAPVLIGGSFGRLPVHPEVMQHLDFSFDKLWAALKRERGYLDKLQSISVSEGQLALVTKGAAAAAR
jgi:hypothetical protein